MAACMMLHASGGGTAFPRARTALRSLSEVLKNLDTRDIPKCLTTSKKSRIRPHM